MDARLTKLADLLVNYATQVQPGERLLVETTGTDPLPLVEEVVRLATAKGALVYHAIHEPAVQRAFLCAANEGQVEALARYDLQRMQEMQCYIGVRGPSNVSELGDVPQQAMDWYNRHYFGPVHIKQRVAHTRWVVLRYPNHAMAQLSKRSLRGFEDFYFDVCTMDYGRMSRAMDALVARMQRTDLVEVKAGKSQLALSIKGMKAIKCDGHVNIPDGEVFTAPVKESVNGTIAFNAGTILEGKQFGAITLSFKDGKCVAVDAGAQTRDVENILDRDAGARFVGEFALGVNPYIEKPMLDTLFDEKIMGSLHMALGNSYDECPNGNKSEIHWDLVHIQTPSYGGGELYFDGELVRRDGLFVVDDLRGLNPAALKG